MSDLRAAMTRRQCIVVQTEEAGVLHMLYPVGTEAVEFVRDARPYMRAADAMGAAVREVGVTEEDREAALARDPAAAAKLLEQRDEYAGSAAELVGKWLPRLVVELAEASEQEVAVLVSNTGGHKSPLVEALAKMVMLAQPLATLPDGVLEDYPFTLPTRPGNP